MMPSSSVEDVDASRETSPDILLALGPESVLVMRRGLGGGKTYNLIIHHYQSHHQISVSSSKSFFLAIITLAQNVQKNV